MHATNNPRHAFSQRAAHACRRWLPPPSPKDPLPPLPLSLPPSRPLLTRCVPLQFGMNQRMAFQVSCAKWGLLWSSPFLVLWLLLYSLPAPQAAISQPGAHQAALVHSLHDSIKRHAAKHHSPHSHLLASPPAPLPPMVAAPLASPSLDRVSAFVYALPFLMVALGLIGCYRRGKLRAKCAPLLPSPALRMLLAPLSPSLSPSLTPSLHRSILLQPPSHSFSPAPPLSPSLARSLPHSLTPCNRPALLSVSVSRTFRNASSLFLNFPSTLAHSPSLSRLPPRPPSRPICQVFTHWVLPLRLLVSLLLHPLLHRSRGEGDPHAGGKHVYSMRECCSEANEFD